MTITFAERLKNVKEYYFSQKLEEIRQMRLKGLDVINLGIGSPDLMPMQSVIESTTKALQSESAHGYASYRSSPELRQAMCRWYQEVYKVEINSESEVLPLLGSKEGVLYVSMALLNPGDSVLVPNPGYPAYSGVAALIGVNVIYYDLTEENAWLPDFPKLDQMDLSRCKLMWTNYPHMPTGASSNPELLKKLIAFGKKKNIFICNDNPYGLVLNREPPLSILSADPKMEISGELNSLSKSFNMAGWRVGMLMASSQLIDAALQVKSNVDSGMFLPVQSGATQALSAGADFHQSRNRVYEERRKVVWKIFDRLGFSYSQDQVGLFVWARAPEKITDVEAYVERVLQTAHVFIVPGFIFGSNGKDYARASLCAPQATLEKALKRIEAFCV
jgi:LL-diaminopimelate aminotransferase